MYLPSHLHLENEELSRSSGLSANCDRSCPGSLVIQSRTLLLAHRNNGLQGNIVAAPENELQSICRSPWLKNVFMILEN